MQDPNCMQENPDFFLFCLFSGNDRAFAQTDGYIIAQKEGNRPVF